MVGIDIVEIKRIRDKLAKNPTFITGCFCEQEINYYDKNGKKPETLAGFFAAKEAVLKALGTGFINVRPLDITITHTPNGAPVAILKNNAKIQLGKRNLNISISHDGGIATAIAIIN